MSLAEDRCRPAHGFIKQSGQDSSVGDIFVTVKMLGEHETGLYRLVLDKKPGAGPARVFIPA